VMMVRGGRSFQNSIDHYFAACDTLVAIRRDVAPGALLPVRYEDLVADPVQGLARVCGFLVVAADPVYLSACGSIIRRIPDRSRDLVDWTQPWIDRVHERMSAFDFLRGYRYEH
jgi:hypothetical protein